MHRTHPVIKTPYEEPGSAGAGSSPGRVTCEELPGLH